MCLSKNSQSTGPLERNDSFQRRPESRTCLKIHPGALGAFEGAGDGGVAQGLGRHLDGVAPAQGERGIDLAPEVETVLRAMPLRWAARLTEPLSSRWRRNVASFSGVGDAAVMRRRRMGWDISAPRT